MLLTIVIHYPRLLLPLTVLPLGTDDGPITVSLYRFITFHLELQHFLIGLVTAAEVKPVNRYISITFQTFLFPPVGHEVLPLFIRPVNVSMFSWLAHSGC